MKSFLSACAAVVILAIGGWVVLDRFQETASEAYTTTGARI